MRKLVVVMENGTIPELNNIMGPIAYPTRITIKAIAEMVKHKRNVLECNPENPYDENSRVKLTMDNIMSINFKQNKKAEDKLPEKIFNGEKEHPTPKPEVYDEDKDDEIPEEEIDEGTTDEAPEEEIPIAESEVHDPQDDINNEEQNSSKPENNKFNNSNNKPKYQNNKHNNKNKGKK